MLGRYLFLKNQGAGEADPLFIKRDIYSDALYEEGILPCKDTETFVIRDGAEDERSIVLPMEYGKCYELRFSACRRLRIAAADEDPRALSAGERMSASEIRFVEGTPKGADLGSLVYIPKKEREFLVIDTGAVENAPLCIYEQVILADGDTEGPWYKPARVGDFLGNADSFADYRWTSDEIYENLYEPLRAAYPDYIKREHIGKDQSGTFDMYCYLFEPKDYEQTVFLSAGMHANEEDAYFALAYFMGEVANANGADAQLHYLRERVRFVVIPLINVWGVNRTHLLEKPNWSIRYNSTETDLNRDFEERTQAETKNVCAVLEKYGESITFGIDFHTTPNDNGSDLFFNFNLGTENAAANFEVTNHIYHRMTEEGMIAAKRPLLVPSSSAYGTLSAVDGEYSASRTLQAYLWNEHGISPITVEYMSFTSGESPAKGSADGLSMAVEILGCFVMKNSYCYAK